jgi:hypothetical protein
VLLIAHRALFSPILDRNWEANLKLKSFLGSIIAGAACMWSVSGPAATLDCTVGTVFYELTSATDVSCGVGNPGDPFNVFGETYTLGDKTDGGGDGTVFFVEFDNSTDPGTWELGFNLDPGQIIENLVIVLKQANSFAAFLIEDGQTSGTWRTTGPGEAEMAISHASSYYTDGEGTVSEPSILALFGVSLLLLGFFRRRTIV